jgi:hypothetical protein
VLAGCTKLTEEDRLRTVSTELELLETRPAQGEVEVDPGVQIDFCFSGRIDPRAIDELDAILSSGEATFDSELSVQLFAWRPPGESVGTADEPWCEGSVLSVRPSTTLMGDNSYRVRLQASAIGWGGESLDTSSDGWTTNESGTTRYGLEFRVADLEGDTDGDTDGDPEDAPPTLTELFSPGEVFDPERESCSCHTDPDHLAHERLDLSTPESAFEGLVQREGLMSTGFPLITPGHAAESYFVQKLLRNEEGAALYAVQGDAMPPGDALPHPDLARIAHWISGGADL